MSDYTKIVDYAPKDALTTGNPAKKIKGTELGAEFDAIATAVATKANIASPTFTGTVTIPTPFTLGAVSVTPTGTELNYVDGVTSNIQTQLDAKMATASYPTVVSLEGLSLVAGDILYSTAADTLARLPKGTASQILAMNGGATAPEWVAAASGLTAASQAQVEAVTSDAVALTPLNAKYHPGVAKAWCVVDISGGAPSLTANLNVSSITDNGVGDFTANLTTALSSSALCAVGMVRADSGITTSNGNCTVEIDAGTALSASSLRIWTKRSAGTIDAQRFNVAIFGDFA